MLKIIFKIQTDIATDLMFTSCVSVDRCNLCVYISRHTHTHTHAKTHVTQTELN